ncbi:MAG: aromatic ring-hydroxylating dioxygenase subunit alpha [Spongiibacteraceae bacterium]
MKSESAITMLPLEDAVASRSKGPLPSHPYFDPAWWELEKKAIFMRTWLHVAHICELPEPGSFIRRDLEFAKVSLLIVRSRDGRINAFHNTCTHRGTQLVSEAQGKRRQFTCPYHKWTFGNDGDFMAAPDFDRFHVDKMECNLKRISLEICSGLIFINLSPEYKDSLGPRESLRDFLGGIADELETMPIAKAVTFYEYTYEIKANWKLNFDNFQENYHVRFIHPRTAEQTLTPENPFGYPVAYGFLGPHRSQTLWKNPSPPPPPETQKFALGRAIEIAQKDKLVCPKVDFKLFPCLHIVGQTLYFFTHTMTPIDAERTRGSIRLYWTSEDDCASRLFTREYITMMLRDIHAEDREIVEAGQRGIRGVDKVFFQDHEVLLRHLHEEVSMRVQAYLDEIKSNEKIASEK